MNQPNDILQKYADAFRELINDRVWSGKDEPSKLLRLNQESDWSFICVAMDIVGDASLAIDNFLEFGLDGPTKYDSTGERYLRLYGLLSAVYIQQEAVRKLFSLMNCPNPKQIKSKYDVLEIRLLRHQIASHGVDFLEPGVKQSQAFVPIRLDLGGFRCSVTENRGNSSKTYELDTALLEHIKLTITVLDAIYEKAIGTLYKGQLKKIEQYKKRLSDLRYERDGNLIYRVGSGDDATELRISFV